MNEQTDRAKIVSEIDKEAHAFALAVGLSGFGYSLPAKITGFTLMAPRVLVALANGNREDTLRAYAAFQVRMLHEIDVALTEFPEVAQSAQQFAAMMEKEAAGGATN